MNTLILFFQMLFGGSSDAHQPHVPTDRDWYWVSTDNYTPWW